VLKVPLNSNQPTNPERDVVRSREPVKF